MYNDIVWKNEESKRIVLRIWSKIHSMLENSRKDVGHFWGLDPRRNGMEPILTNRTKNGTGLLSMMLNFAEGGYPVIRAPSALERRK